MRDLVLTWPKSAPLRVYLDTLRAAAERGEVINYRVHAPPQLEDGSCERVYMVHDGKVRGWSPFLAVNHVPAGVVRDRGGGYWPEGWYIVRSPDWVDLDPEQQTSMRGFQGYRYIEREESTC